MRFSVIRAAVAPGNGVGKASTLSLIRLRRGFLILMHLGVVLGEAMPRSDRAPRDDRSRPNRQEVDDDAGRSEPPVASPPPPPPVRAGEDLESTVELTPEQALHGTAVELSLDDGTVVELQTPPQAGDGWRLRLEGVAAGGRDHFLQLRVQTPDGLRIDGLRVHYKLELFPPDAALGCAVDVPTLDGPVAFSAPWFLSGRLLRLRGRGLVLDERPAISSWRLW